jgi:hypothetical protein
LVPTLATPSSASQINVRFGAARAVGDALPFLQKAKQVKIVIVSDKASDHPIDRLPTELDNAPYFAALVASS